jgi:hypothetical protein
VGDAVGDAVGALVGLAVGALVGFAGGAIVGAGAVRLCDQSAAKYPTAAATLNEQSIGRWQSPRSIHATVSSPMDVMLHMGKGAALDCSPPSVKWSSACAHIAWHTSGHDAMWSDGLASQMTKHALTHDDGVGADVGDAVGALVGLAIGADDGAPVGLTVGVPVVAALVRL